MLQGGLATTGRDHTVLTQVEVGDRDVESVVLFEADNRPADRDFVTIGIARHGEVAVGTVQVFLSGEGFTTLRLGLGIV